MLKANMIIVVLCGDMKVYNDAFIAQHGHPDVIITDPPRDGMHKDVIEQIMKIAPENRLYCNSATQARDLALMDEIQSNSRTSCRYVSTNASRRECGTFRRR
jgi:hypothetical protein